MFGDSPSFGRRRDRPGLLPDSRAGGAGFVGMVEQRIGGGRCLAPLDAAFCGPFDRASIVVIARTPRRPARPLVFQLERLDLDLLLDQALDVAHHARVVARDQRDRQSRRAGAAGAADAVHVVLGVERHVVVEHRGQVDDVEAARGHVGGHQQLHVAALERIERLQPLILRLVAMQRRGLQAIALERPRQARSAELRVDEDQRLRQLALA